MTYALVVLAAALTALPAWLGARALALGSPIRTILAAAMFAWATVVLLAQILSAVDAWARWPLLACHAGIALTATLVAHRRPPPRSGLTLSGIAAWLRGLPGDYRAAVMVLGLVGTVSLVLAVVVAPNNADSMVYHLSRAAYWAQEQSVFHFHGAGARQASMPPGAEILLSWSIVLAEGDRLTQVVQWLCYLLVTLGVHELTRLLGFGRGPAVLAALVAAALPQTVLQSSTTQNDLAVTATLLCAALFGADALMRRRWRGSALVAATATALALATKSTALVAIPLVALVLVGVAVRLRVSPLRVVELAAATAVAAALLAGFNYFENLQDFGRLTAPQEFAERGAGGPGPVAPLDEERAANVVRMTWSTFVETVPFEPGSIVADVARAVDRAAPAVTTRDHPERPQLLQFDFEIAGLVDEDSSGYGLLGLLVLLPCAAVALARGGIGRSALALAAVAGIILMSQAVRYSEANGRILMPFAVALAPLVAVCATRMWSRTAVVALACSGAVLIVLLNPSKPLLPVDGETIFGLSRTESQELRNREFAAATRRLERYVAPDEPLGVRALETAYDYPLFGPRFKRTVHRVVPSVDDEMQGIVDGRPVAGIVYVGVSPPPNLRTIALAPSHILVLHRPGAQRDF